LCFFFKKNCSFGFFSSLSLFLFASFFRYSYQKRNFQFVPLFGNFEHKNSNFLFSIFTKKGSSKKKEKIKKKNYTELEGLLKKEEIKEKKKKKRKKEKK